MRNKIIIISILLSFFMVMIPSFSDNVKATVYMTENFDGTNAIVNGGFTNAYLTSYIPIAYVSNFKVVNTVSHSTTKSFYLLSQNCQYGKWNSTTLLKSSVVSEYSFYFRWYKGINDIIRIYFRDNKSAIVFSVYWMLNDITLSGGSDDSTTVCNSASLWYHMVIDYAPDHTITAYIYNGTTDILMDTLISSSISHTYFEKLNQITFTGGGNNVMWVYLDDFIISSGGGGSTPSDFSQYKVLGNLPTLEITLANGNNPVIEERYEQKFTGSIYGIDIPNWNDIPSNWNIGFNIQINGFGYTPTSMYNLSIYGISDILHVYRFDFSTSPLVFSDEKILIEFYSAITTPYGKYYIPSGSNSDVDGDGITEYKTGSHYYFNGLYDGSNTYSKEFCYLLYYSGASGEIPETETTYSYLSIYGNNLKYNGTSPEFYRNDTVSIGWGISDITIQNKIVLRYGGSDISSQLFPFIIYSPKGAIGYCPEKIGNYTVRLYCNGIVTRTRYFDVISNPNVEENNYQIHTIPPMTYDFSTYTVKYNYNNAFVYDGNIACFEKSSDVYNFSKNIYNRDINGTIYGGSFIRVPSSKEHNEYWQIFVRVGSTYVPKGNFNEHFIIKSDSSCNMIVDYGQNLGGKAYTGVNLTIYGTHVYPLQDINVYANGQKIQYVGDDTYYYFMYKPTKAITYEFTLQLRLNNGTLYSLVEPIDVIVYAPPENEGGGGIIPSGWSIDPPFSYFFGIAIVIITTLSPLLITGVTKRDFNLSSIPQFLYLIMAIVGFVITLLLGFFPAWSILVLVVLGGLIIAIMWLKGNSKTGE